MMKVVLRAFTKAYSSSPPSQISQMAKDNYEPATAATKDIRHKKSNENKTTEAVMRFFTFIVNIIFCVCIHVTK